METKKIIIIVAAIFFAMNGTVSAQGKAVGKAIKTIASGTTIRQSKGLGKIHGSFDYIPNHYNSYTNVDRLIVPYIWDSNSVAIHVYHPVGTYTVPSDFNNPNILLPMTSSMLKGVNHVDVFVCQSVDHRFVHAVHTMPSIHSNLSNHTNIRLLPMFFFSGTGLFGSAKWSLLPDGEGRNFKGNDTIVEKPTEDTICEILYQHIMSLKLEIKRHF